MESNTGQLPGAANAGWQGRRFQPRALRLGILGLVAIVLFGGCAKTEDTATAASDAPKTYALTGEVLSVDSERNVLVVRHDDIPGFMPAMTMEFIVSPGDVARLCRVVGLAGGAGPQVAAELGRRDAA